MRISDWSSDVCSSDLFANQRGNIFNERSIARQAYVPPRLLAQIAGEPLGAPLGQVLSGLGITLPSTGTWTTVPVPTLLAADANSPGVRGISSSDNTGSPIRGVRSEEHTSELQSLMRHSYAVFRLKKKK